MFNILKRKKRKMKHNVNTYKTETNDKKIIIIKTMIDLDENQKETIFKIIEKGIESGTEISNINLAIMMETGINAIMMLNVSESGKTIELSF